MGLKVNVGKSAIVPIGEVNNLDALANILHCRVDNLLMKYLGMPLGTSFKTASIWNPILEKVEKKLSKWKCLYLSKGGRLMLLKSSLSSLPTYFLFLFTIPKTVTARLESIQRNFLWGSFEGSFKYPLVAWEKVCLPLEMGGLGIRSVVPFNQALLEKWLWRYGHEVTHLWRQVISTKYGEVKGDGKLMVVGGLMGVAYGEALMKGGRAFLSICPLLWVKALVFAFGMIGGLVIIL